MLDGHSSNWPNILPDSLPFDDSLNEKEQLVSFYVDSIGNTDWFLVNLR
jgi:hypothetical protein